MTTTQAARAGLSCRSCWRWTASNVAIVAVWKARHSHSGAPTWTAAGSTGRGREAAAGTARGWKWWDRSAAPRPKTSCCSAIRVQRCAGSHTLHGVRRLGGLGRAAGAACRLGWGGSEERSVVVQGQGGTAATGRAFTWGGRRDAALGRAVCLLPLGCLSEWSLAARGDWRVKLRAGWRARARALAAATGSVSESGGGESLVERRLAGRLVSACGLAARRTLNLPVSSVAREERASGC